MYGAHLLYVTSANDNANENFKAEAENGDNGELQRLKHLYE